MMIIPIGSLQPEAYARWLREQSEPDEYTGQRERLEKYLGRELTREEHFDTLEEYLDMQGQREAERAQQLANSKASELPESLSGVFYQH